MYVKVIIEQKVWVSDCSECNVVKGFCTQIGHPLQVQLAHQIQGQTHSPIQSIQLLI